MPNITLYHDDCFNIFPLLEDKSIDLVLCDMPYGTTACKWDTVLDLERMWEELERIRKEKCGVIIFGTEPFSSFIRTNNLSNYKYDWVWDKVTGIGHLVAKHRPLQQVENIMVFYTHNYYPQMKERPKNKIKYTKEYKRTELMGGNSNMETAKMYTHWYPKNIITCYNGGNLKKLHPTQKPVTLMEYLIKTYSNENDTVLDFCMGSGTTGVACKNLNRNFIGIEKEEKYFNIAKERIGE